MSARAPLDILASCIPTWFHPVAEEDAVLSGRAVVPVAGGATDFEIALLIEPRGRGVSVRERPPLTLPEFCPERHINEGGAFCLGYETGTSIPTRNGAVVLWEVLRHFLLLQRIAARTRRWPSGHAIAHGNAGPYHIAAREAAAALSILGAYGDGVAGGVHWATSGTIKSTRTGDRLLKGRLRCPLGCSGRRGKPLVRRECCRKADVVKLVWCDGQRREEEQRYWATLKSRKVECCGTLDNCPLLQTQAADGTRRVAPPHADRRRGHRQAESVIIEI